MNLCEGNDIQRHCRLFVEDLRREVSEMKDSDIVSCNLSEYAEYLSDKYRIPPIVLHDEGIKKRMEETQLLRTNCYGTGRILVDGVQITYTIPYDGSPDLLDMQSDFMIKPPLTIANLKTPVGENMGSFDIIMEFTQKELHNQRDEADMRDYVQSEFRDLFSNYQYMFDRVNRVVNEYNDDLRGVAMEALTSRKERADSLAAISQALEIPLKLSNDAPNTTPIKLKRAICKPISKPIVKPSEPEYCISDFDYNNINNIIYLFSTAMERTARSYYINQEEELRDHLLAALNVYYDCATGETFSRLGKTDISVGFENRSAFIGECKLWKGEQVFSKTIQQVMNYLTWRDLKASVIIFNKNNTSFQPILSTVQSWVEKNARCQHQKHPNVWECTYHRQDMGTDVKLTIMVFDLYVDETQFSNKHKEKK